MVLLVTFTTETAEQKKICEIKQEKVLWLGKIYVKDVSPLHTRRFFEFSHTEKQLYFFSKLDVPHRKLIWTEKILNIFSFYYFLMKSDNGAEMLKIRQEWRYRDTIFLFPFTP